jgi:hypothetical protein
MSSIDRCGPAQPEFLFELLDREAELVVGGYGSGKHLGSILQNQALAQRAMEQIN